MEHSSNYNKVKRYFVLGVWNVGRVRDAVEKAWITIAEFEEITGTTY
ncbi:MAG TPA: XkdX family protein [Bacteroidales bacterium]|jgi:hypothetical protein|nr:XkdX family protein [Bacteroidales bacterium]